MVDTSSSIKINIQYYRLKRFKMLMRLDYKKIYDMQKEISVERNERERSYKKYNKIDTTCNKPQGKLTGYRF